MPLAFEPNIGQADPQVKFLSRGPGYTLFLTSSEAVLVFHSPVLSSEAHQGSHGVAEPAFSRQTVLRLKLVGGNRRLKAEGFEPLPGKSNYFLGNDPKKWRTNVPNYAQVRFEGVYPGVDLVYHGSHQGQLEYDFIVAPGADPASIALEVRGADQLQLSEDGDLLLQIGGEQVRLYSPIMYQEQEGKRTLVAGRFVVRRQHQVGFEVGAYDAGQPLVIDPTLVYSSYLGGSGFDVGNSIAVDIGGNAYVTGRTESADFPTMNAFDGTFGGGDAFVTKFNPSGSVLYSTYLGGSIFDEAQDIAVDGAGNAYITGEAGSTDFPTTMGAFDTSFNFGFDAFVTKLNSSGSALLYSTYLGGSSDDFGDGIAVDASGNAYVIGETLSTTFPTSVGAFDTTPNGGVIGFDAFVTKFNAAGSALVYSSYLGGSGDDIGEDIAVDTANPANAYVTGRTSSTNFPTSMGAFDTSCGTDGTCNGGLNDAFVTKFNAAGSALLYSTYLGGSENDFGDGIAVDSGGNAYVTGNTGSPEFPTTTGAFKTVCNPCSDAFVTKFNPAGSALVYSTYLGGTQILDYGFGIAVDSAGNAYVAGQTGATNFPTASPIQAALGGGVTDAFVTKFNAAGSALVYSTYLGGSGLDSAFGIAVDTANPANAYVTGRTNSTAFPLASPFQAAFRGGDDAFVAKISPTDPPPSVINSGGVVCSADFAAGACVVPGSIVSVFGSDLANFTQRAVSTPLPTTLGGTTLQFNTNLPVPLFFASPLQINGQIPWELQGQANASLTSTLNGMTSPAEIVPLAAFGPGLFAINQAGTGQGAILIANTATFAAPVGSIPGATSQPAVRDVDFLEIYWTGGGAVTNQPASGAAAPLSPLSTTTTMPTLTIGGVDAPVLFSGLAPGFVGSYVVTCKVPASAPVGSAVPVVLTIGGVQSNTVTIAVQ